MENLGKTKCIMGDVAAVNEGISVLKVIVYNTRDTPRQRHLKITSEGKIQLQNSMGKGSSPRPSQLARTFT